MAQRLRARFAVPADVLPDPSVDQSEWPLDRVPSRAVNAARLAPADVMTGAELVKYLQRWAANEKGPPRKPFTLIVW